MATYNTGNPIGSTDSRDRLDNTENMDYLENSTTELTRPDRLGNVRKTRHGMGVEHDAQISAHEVEHDAQISAHESEFDIKMAGMAFSRVGTFAAGYTLTDARQTLLYATDGHDYGWTGAFPKVVAAGATPATSGGIGAGAWVDRTDVTLRSDLASESGSGLVGYRPAGTGAVATTVQSKLQEMVSVKDFGAVGDGVTDDTAAIQAALVYAYNLAPQSGWRMHTAEVRLPRGRYRIAQPNTLFAGLTYGSFNIVGDGKDGVTQIIYDVPSAGGNDYLIYNNNLFGFTQFSGITFASAKVTSEQNFMYYSSTGIAQNLSFTDCKFVNFSLLFNVQGTANSSEVTFINCKFNSFSDAAFRFNNSQAVNWRFFGCDAEVFTGTLFENLQGLNVYWFQGSIIPAPFGTIIRIPSGANDSGSGSGNNPIATFYGVRFELRGSGSNYSKLFWNEKLAFYAAVIFNQCGMGGANLSGQPVDHCVIDFRDHSNLYFYHCHNMTNFRVKALADNGSSHTRKSVIYLHNCDATAKNILASSEAFLTSSGPNVQGLPIFVEDSDGATTYYTKYGTSKFASRSEKVVAVAGVEANDKNSAISNFVVGEPKTIWTVDASYTRVSKVRVEIEPAWSGGFGGMTFTVNIKSVDGATTHATGTLNSSSGLVLEYVPTFPTFMQSGKGFVVEFVPTTIWSSVFGFQGRVLITN